MLTDEMRKDGWIEHDGGPCPVPPQRRVIVRYRSDPDDFDFARYRTFTAGNVPWGRYEWAQESEIVAYRPEPRHD